MNVYESIKSELEESSITDVSSISEGLINYVVNSIKNEEALVNKGIKFDVEVKPEKITFTTLQDGKPINVQLLNIQEIERSIK